MNFIQGDKFIDIADFTYTSPSKSKDDYGELRKTLRYSKLKDKDVIYTHTMYVDQLFKLIGNDQRRFTLVSHNSDINVDESFKVPPNVIKWYSQNVCVKDDRIESIPIGLENDRWFPDIDKKAKMLEKLHQSKSCRNWVYMNHNVKNNISKRLGVYRLLKDTTWTTTEMLKNGNDFDRYLDNIYNHRFVICPEGNGTDTHRTWETLYMGSIPIEKKNINNQFYRDLPICFVNYWEEINEEFLESEYARIKERTWNMEMLDFDYWKNKIHGLDTGK